MHNRWVHKETDDYCVELERARDGNLFIHVSITTWNHRVYRQLISDWISLETVLRDSGERTIYGILPKSSEEFALLFGWTLIKTKDGRTLVGKEI